MGKRKTLDYFVEAIKNDLQKNPNIFGTEYSEDITDIIYESSSLDKLFSSLQKAKNKVLQAEPTATNFEYDVDIYYDDTSFYLKWLVPASEADLLQRAQQNYEAYIRNLEDAKEKKQRKEIQERELYERLKAKFES